MSEELKGPRFRPMLKQEVDAYANLILLCPSDHKIVDDAQQAAYYTGKRLHDLKREHEQWIKDKLSPMPSAMNVHDLEAGKPLLLQRVDTSKE